MAGSWAGRQLEMQLAWGLIWQRQVVSVFFIRPLKMQIDWRRSFGKERVNANNDTVSGDVVAKTVRYIRCKPSTHAYLCKSHKSRSLEN